jgi:hypothetical protein
MGKFPQEGTTFHQRQTKARNIQNVSSDEGANMRSHENFMHKGQWVHPYRDPTLTYEEPPALFPNKTLGVFEEPKPRTVYNLIGSNDEERANKRSHESAVPSRHKMHPSKIPRKETSDISDQSSVAESSDDMNQSSSSSSNLSGHYHSYHSHVAETFANVVRSAKVYRKPSVHPSQEGETNPYSPIQRG